MKTGFRFTIIFLLTVGALAMSPIASLAGRDGGYDVTAELWAKAVLQVSGAPVTLIWREVGSDITPSGDRVISGYFFADPYDFAYGSQYNPEVFVKIYIAGNGWCNIAFNHVTVDNVTVYSAHRYDGQAQKMGTVTLSGRLVEHQYDGVAIGTVPSNSQSSATGNTNGYPLTSGLWARASLQPSGGAVPLIWKKVGSEQTPSGDLVVSGYFYASPEAFAYGSEYNPELFVKIYIAQNGWANIAFNHVTVDNVVIDSAKNYSGSAGKSGTAMLSVRLLEHTYEGVAISNETEEIFDYGSVTQSASQLINSGSGGSVQLNGAMLTISPGTMSESAEISLYAVSLPTAELPAGDGGYGGQTPLSDTSYLIGVDRDVTMSGPIRITLPVNAAELPGNVQLSQLHISALNGGVIIPQGTPDSFDAAAGTVTFSFNPPYLKKDFTHQAILEPAQAAGFPFLTLVSLTAAKLTAIAGVSASLFLNPFVTSMDDASTTFTFSTYNSEHFNVTYRGANVTIGHAIDVAVALEKAYTLFVTQMGFSLPNFVNLDSQYTVYLDDFNNHYYFKLMGATQAEGITLPGSSLFEGASYVNNTVSSDKWVSTAVHEYFHALQYGVIQSAAPNLFQSIIYPESGWLFEGSATVLSGRVVYGDSSAPARDSQLGSHLTQGKSLFNPEQTPAADVAQDFFYYLEKVNGDVSFYRPMFEALGAELGSEIPTSVSAADEVLRESDTTGNSSLSGEFYRFIYDMAIENGAEYGGNITGDTIKTLSSSATSAGYSQDLQGLSYYIIDVNVQKLDSNQPAYNQPRDVKLKIALTSSGSLTGKVIIDAKQGGQRVSGFPKESAVTSAIAFEETLDEFRTGNTGWIRMVVVNDALGRDDKISVSATAGLAVETEAGYHISYASYTGSTRDLTVKNLTTGSTWIVGQGTPIGMSASGYLIWETASGAMMITGSWGKGSSLDLKGTSACRASSYADDENLSITDAGRAYYPGSYEYIYTNGDKQERRTNYGIVSCLGDGSGFVDVRFDYNQSGGPIDGIDSFSPDELKIAKTGRPIVFNAGNYRLGVVDTSGAGFMWLTDSSNLSFSQTGWASNICISDNGETVAFTTQVSGNHHLIVMPTAGGTPLNLTQSTQSTGFELWSSGATLSPDGDSIAVFYNDTTDAGLVLINTSSGAIIRKISGFSIGLMPAESTSPPQFTPDGQFIVLAAYKITGYTIEGYPDIFMMKTDGTEVRNLTGTPTVAELKVLVR